MILCVSLCAIFSMALAASSVADTSGSAAFGSISPGALCNSQIWHHVTPTNSNFKISINLYDSLCRLKTGVVEWKENLRKGTWLRVGKLLNSKDEVCNWKHWGRTQKLVIDYWRWLYIKPSLIWSKRPQPNSRERSAIGPEANPTSRPIQSFGEVLMLIPGNKVQGLAWTASHGVAQEAGNGWLAARLMPFIPKLNGGSEWYYDNLSSKMITPQIQILDTQGY